MTKTSLAFPQGFDSYASEVEAKGWFAEAKLVLSGKQHRLTFYDPVRLGQEIEDQLQRGTAFFEPNLVVIPSVTRENMEKAVDILIQSGGVDSLSVEQ